MEPCRGGLVTLTEGFVQLPVDQALFEILTAKIKDSSIYFECRRKHEDLVRWINESVTQK